MVEGILKGHRIIIPRHVRAMDRFDRRDWLHARGILELIEGATNYGGAETLASMTIAGTATAPTVTPGTSMLTRECLESVAPSYFKLAGSRFKIQAYGTILSTAVITSQQIALQVGPTYANPLTAGQMLSQFPAVITPAAAVIAEWWLNVMVTVRATGPSGSLIAYGVCINNIAAAASFVSTPHKNTAIGVAATPVVLTGTGGLLAPNFFDLVSIQGAATAGNSGTCLDYELVSMN